MKPATGEIQRPLLRLTDGESFTATSDGALVITDDHSHSDILRYVIGDVGKAHASQLLASLEEGA